MAAKSLRFVTLSGVPIEVAELKWPFHQSTAGADWLVLHGRADLLQSAENLHCEVAVGLTQTMKEALGSLAEEHAEGMAVNAIRKTIDNGQLAFMKSGKVQPVHVTSRFYNFREKRIEFPAQPEAAVLEMLKRRVFWLGSSGPVGIAHPYDCQYVNLSREMMLELAGKLASQGMIKLEGDQATATDTLRKQEVEIRAAMQKGVEAGLAATKVTA
ncbi:MAG TPA: hypothetical protein VNW97_12255 [Candidatus Saccharimonadales bacterium]|jgi:hypothetical protein|nr:hypothetical protein [Candidatus Saccharimonadales bacterium]